MNVSETARALGVTPRRVRARIEAGSIDAHKVGGRWVVGEPVVVTRRRPLSVSSRDALSRALTQRTLGALTGQQRARTAARIRALRASEDPAQLLIDWWGGRVPHGIGFAQSLVANALAGEREYVKSVFHRPRTEYLRRGTDLADVIRTERAIRGLTRRQLADAAHVAPDALASLERAEPLTSPAAARRILRYLNIEPTALPDLEPA